MKYRKLTIRTPKKDTSIEKKKLVQIKGMRLHMNPLVEERVEGIFRGSAFFLDPNFDWFLGKDNKNQVILVPLKK